jgi:hypothetical protein
MVHTSFWLMPMMGGRVRTVKKNAEALVVATKEIGLEVNDHVIIGTSLFQACALVTDT